MEALEGAVEHRVEVNGVRLRVTELGVGPPVVLLHGFPQHGSAWREVATRLAADHRVIVPDMRGFGGSDAPRTGYGSRTRVDDVEALLDAMELDRVVVCGHEWGGWVGFRLALRSPERVTGLVALNVQHPWPLHRRSIPTAWRYWYTALFEPPLLGRLVLRRVPAFTRFLLLRGRAGDRAAAEAYAELLRQPDRARAGEKLHRAFIFGDILPLVFNRYRRHTLTRPAILLAGTHDPVVGPRAVDRVYPAQPALDVRMVDGGHYLHEDDPDAVAATVRELATRSQGSVGDRIGGVTDPDSVGTAEV